MQRSRLIITALTLVGALGLSACGSDAPKSTATIVSETTAATATGAATGGSLTPEEIVVDDATVTAGFTKLASTIAVAIAAIGTPDAKAKLAVIEDDWRGFEGAVRKKDPTIYLSIEDQLTPLQRQIAAGDTATATATATTLEAIFSQYVAKYP